METDLSAARGDEVHLAEVPGHGGLRLLRLLEQHFPDLRIAHEHRLQQRADDRGARDRADVMRAVQRRPDRIVDLRDDALHAEDLARDLRRHEVTVVAMRQRKDRIGLIDARGTQNLHVRAVAEQRRTAEALWQVYERTTVEIDDRDRVTSFVELAREEGADPPASDDDDVQRVSS